MGYRIQNRRDTAARWAEMNPILLEGEMGIVLDDPNQYKIGDGVHTWNELPLRGFTGTIAQTLGNNENAVASQKVVTEKFAEQDEKLSDIGSKVGKANLVGKGDEPVAFIYKNALAGRIYRIVFGNPSYNVSEVGSEYNRLNVGYSVGGTYTNVYGVNSLNTINEYYDVKIPIGSVDAEIQVSIRANTNEIVCLGIEDISDLKIGTVATQHIQLKGRGTEQVKEDISLEPNTTYFLTTNGWNTNEISNDYALISILNPEKNVEICRVVKGAHDLSKGVFFNTDERGVYTLSARGSNNVTMELTLRNTKNAIERKILKFSDVVVHGCYIRRDSFEVGLEESFGITPMFKLLAGVYYNITGATTWGGAKWAKFDLDKNHIENFNPYGGTSVVVGKSYYLSVESDCYVMASIHKNDFESLAISGLFDLDVWGTIKNPNTKNYSDYGRLLKNRYNPSNQSEDVKTLNGTMMITPLIDVSKGDVIKVKGFTNVGNATKVACYDVHRNYIGTLDESNGTTFYPINFDGYLSFSIPTKDRWVVINRVIGTSVMDGIDSNEYGIETIWNVADANDFGRFNYRTVGVLDYYAAFDELTYLYRSIKKQSDIGTSTEPSEHWANKDNKTYPIRRYTIKNPNANPSRTIVLCGGIHGDSQSKEGGVIYNDDNWYNTEGDSAQNILSQYYFTLDFLRNPYKNDLYKYLYDNYVIELVPIINPWGVQNHSRGNGRGVDLNHNFDYNWKEYNRPSGDYTLTAGTSAFSENESLAFRDFFNSLSNVELCLEIHSRGNILVPSSLQFLVAVPNDDAVKTKSSRILEEIICNQYEGINLGWSVAVATHASLANWVYNIKGVDSIEPECCQTLNSNINTRNSKIVNYLMAGFVSTFMSWWCYTKYNKFTNV